MYCIVSLRLRLRRHKLIGYLSIRRTQTAVDIYPYPMQFGSAKAEAEGSKLLLHINKAHTIKTFLTPLTFDSKVSGVKNFLNSMGFVNKNFQRLDPDKYWKSLDLSIHLQEMLSVV